METLGRLSGDLDIPGSCIGDDVGEKGHIDAVFGVWMRRANPKRGQFDTYCLTLNNSIRVGNLTNLKVSDALGVSLT